jgi:hypothetical protein
MKRLLFLIAVALIAHAGTDVWTPLGPYGASVGTLVADPGNPGTYTPEPDTAADCTKLPTEELIGPY